MSATGAVPWWISLAISPPPSNSCAPHRSEQLAACGGLDPLHRDAVLRELAVELHPGRRAAARADRGRPQVQVLRIGQRRPPAAGALDDLAPQGDLSDRAPDLACGRAG